MTLALIGAGRWGKNLARNFYELKALKAICDSSEKLLQSYGDIYPGVLLLSDPEEVFNNKEITQVAIAAPAVKHYELAKRALLAGKDVFVEKPLCLNVEEGKELIALACQMNKVLMVGHLLRYHPCVEKLLTMVNAGDLGQLYSISSTRLNLGQIRTEENVLWSFAPHDVSVILALTGNRLPAWVRANGGAYLSNGVADETVMSMKFDNGVLAHVHVSWLHPFKEQKLVVVGSKGMAVFDDTLAFKEKLKFYPDPVGWREGRIPEAKKVTGLLVEVDQDEPLKAECTHFLTCCREKIPALTDGEEGLRVLTVLQMAEKSLSLEGEKSFLQTDYFAHPTAVIDPKAKIGRGVKVWHFSHVMADASLGDNCNIGQNVVVSPGVSLGKNVKVQNNVSIYSGVECEDDVFLGPSMVFTNVSTPRSAVNRRGQYEKTIVRKGASIGANSTVVSGNELGAYCFIGAGSVVTKSVKPYALMVGNPARQVGWMSRYGQKLNLPVKAEKGEVLTAICEGSGEIYRLTEDTLEAD